MHVSAWLKMEMTREMEFDLCTYVINSTMIASRKLLPRTLHGSGHMSATGDSTPLDIERSCSTSSTTRNCKHTVEVTAISQTVVSNNSNFFRFGNYM